MDIQLQHFYMIFGNQNQDFIANKMQVIKMNNVFDSCSVLAQSSQKKTAIYIWPIIMQLCYTVFIYSLCLYVYNSEHVSPCLCPPPTLSLPRRESKVQSEVQVPKVILAGRCSKSSAVTGTVVVRAIARAEHQVELGCVEQLTWRNIIRVNII